MIVGTVAVVATAAAGIVEAVAHHGPPATADRPVVITLAARPMSYLGAFARGAPASYAPLDAFAVETGVRPNIALYYSGWGERFKAAFAWQAARHHAVPLVQIDPGNTRLSLIADGSSDAYLESYARQVARYGAQTGQAVIIGFGHEPNGNWYPWGFGHASPAAWVAAWRHIVTVFRRQGADDVTWLWTVNIIDIRGGITTPGSWWPGARYVTWVGIDGYYYERSWKFASLFGPTIRAVRALTRDPILISEAGAAPQADKPAKISDLFAGIRAYGLLGLVWFDVDGTRDWRIDSPAAVAAYRAGAREFGSPVS